MIPTDCVEALKTPVMQQIIRVESGGNPFAIGVVGNQLVRQPRNLDEAVATAQALERAGYNFSIGTGQVNKVHFDRLGWKSNIRTGFDNCANVEQAARIFNDCYARAEQKGYAKAVDKVIDKTVYTATHAALSCYYSGDFVRGGRLGYVGKVLGAGAAAPGKAPKKTVATMMLTFD